MLLQGSRHVFARAVQRLHAASERSAKFIEKRLHKDNVPWNLNGSSQENKSYFVPGSIMNPSIQVDTRGPVNNKISY